MGNETFYWDGLVTKPLRDLRLQLCNVPELRESLTSCSAEVRLTVFFMDCVRGGTGVVYHF